jgi:hypothetical protein
MLKVVIYDVNERIFVSFYYVCQVKKSRYCKNDITFLPELKRELPTYLANCAGVVIDHADVGEFTAAVLGWWASHGPSVPTWAQAVRIIGSFNVNSAAAERVFSALKRMFGDAQMTTLSYYIQAALMLHFNKRQVG